MDINFHPIFRALRVVQLDVDELERSIEDTALDQYKKVLESACIADTNAHKPEALVVLRCLFWFYSVRTHNATLGQRMMGVFYENFNFKVKIRHFILTILMPYLRLNNIERRKYIRLLERKIKCAICLKSPIIPCHIGCSHVFCYYCIAAHKQEDSSFPCPSCDHSSYNLPINPILSLNDNQ